MNKVIVMAVILCAAAAQAESDLSRPEYYACRSDNECVIMADPCGFPAGINRRYQNAYGVASYNTGRADCPTPGHALRDFTVHCDDLTCKPQLKPEAIEQPQ